MPLGLSCRSGEVAGYGDSCALLDLWWCDHGVRGRGPAKRFRAGNRGRARRELGVRHDAARVRSVRENIGASSSHADASHLDAGTGTTCPSNSRATAESGPLADHSPARDAGSRDASYCDAGSCDASTSSSGDAGVCDAGTSSEADARTAACGRCADAGRTASAATDVACAAAAHDALRRDAGGAAAPGSTGIHARAVRSPVDVRATPPGCGRAAGAVRAATHDGTAGGGRDERPLTTNGATGDALGADTAGGTVRDASCGKHAGRERAGGTRADQPIPCQRSQRQSQTVGACARVGHRCLLSTKARRGGSGRYPQAALSGGD